MAARVGSRLRHGSVLCGQPSNTLTSTGRTLHVLVVRHFCVMTLSFELTGQSLQVLLLRYFLYVNRLRELAGSFISTPLLLYDLVCTGQSSHGLAVSHFFVCGCVAFASASTPGHL